MAVPPPRAAIAFDEKKIRLLCLRQLVVELSVNVSLPSFSQRLANSKSSFADQFSLSFIDLRDFYSNTNGAFPGNLAGNSRKISALLLVSVSDQLRFACLY